MDRQLGYPVGHHATGICCAASLDTHVSRRRFLQVTAGGGTAATLAPWHTFAASGTYEAMVLAYIDPRIQEPVRQYTAGRHLTGKYSQFTIAGASIGVVAAAFKDWHKTFWDNLGASVQLHSIEKVIVINHRDCGAAKIAYGEAAVADTAAKTKTHREALAEFRKQLAERHPKLGIETGLMTLDGTFELCRRRPTLGTAARCARPGRVVGTPYQGKNPAASLDAYGVEHPLHK
jgi:carbonic anhydrase-like protein